MPALLAIVVSIRLFNISAASAPIVDEAQRLFTQIYAAIGVTVEWTDRPSALLLIVRDDEPGDLRRASQPVLGAAIHTANGSPVAYVFYRRASDQAEGYAIGSSAVLATAMAHEVGHLLLPTGEHSRDGLMRACWDYTEFLRAATGQLRFSKEEGEKIRSNSRSPGRDDR